MKKNIILIVCTVFSLISCNSLLDIPQHGVLDENNFYQTDEDAASAVAAAYADLGGSFSFYNLEFTFTTLNGYLGDEYWQGQNSRSATLDAYLEYIFDANDAYIAAHYQNLYSIIGKCNLVVDKVKGDTRFQKQVIAEAKTLRAWMYFELTTLWGNPPLVDHVMSASDDAPTNADPAVLWKFMEDNLTEAISSGALTEKAGLGDRSNYRITKQYAQALLGKVYLWQGKNAEAAAVLEEVIESKLYDLYRGEYGDMYDMENENGPESMFESNRVYDKENHITSFVPSSTGLCGYTRPDMAEPNGYANPLHLFWNAWGGFVPRGTVYDAFVAEEGADGYRLNQSIKTYDFMAAAGYPIDPSGVEYSEGFFQWKGRYLTDQFDMYAGSFPSVYRNVRWMRYAEVLLMAAEANIGLNQGKADKYLNEVRERAKLPWKTCDLDAIKTERRLELLGDFCRYKDLQRWGDAKKVLANNGALEPVLSVTGVEWKSFTSTYGYKEGKHETLPFPNAEILANKNIHQHEAWK